LLTLLSRSEMLDPLTALSVSCSVLQIVDFAGGLVSKTKEYYDNGFLIDHKDYAAAATKLEALTEELEKSTSKKSTQPTSEEIALRNITAGEEEGGVHWTTWSYFQRYERRGSSSDGLVRNECISE